MEKWAPKGDIDGKVAVLEGVGRRAGRPFGFFFLKQGWMWVMEMVRVVGTGGGRWGLAMGWDRLGEYKKYCAANSSY